DVPLVNDALLMFLNLDVEMTFGIIQQFVESKQKPPEPTEVYIEVVDLNHYDQLLETPECVSV
ncbi:MAG: hypothetical protein ABFD91_05665, partial [Anaerohalosphaeraceae bacterium]